MSPKIKNKIKRKTYKKKKKKLSRKEAKGKKTKSKISKISKKSKLFIKVDRDVSLKEYPVGMNL